jgi:hypothetical protein
VRISCQKEIAAGVAHRIAMARGTGLSGAHSRATNPIVYQEKFP